MARREAENAELKESKEILQMKYKALKDQVLEEEAKRKASKKTVELTLLVDQGVNKKVKLGSKWVIIVVASKGGLK